MTSTTMEIGRALTAIIGIGGVLLATRPTARSRGSQGSKASKRAAIAPSPDESSFAHQRLGAAGRNRWDRRDLVRGIGVDPDAGEPDLTVWPGQRLRVADR